MLFYDLGFIKSFNIENILQINTYTTGDLIAWFIDMFCSQFNVDIVSSFFYSSLENNSLRSIERYFKQNIDNHKKSNLPMNNIKPCFNAKKLVIPIFLEGTECNLNHWMLLVCLEIRKKWHFWTIDSLNNEIYHNRVKTVILSRSKLHSIMKYINDSPCYMFDQMEFDFKMLKVRSQKETECGCRLILHMYIACISSGITELKKELQKLKRITDISKYCREWVYYVMKNTTSLRPFQSVHSLCSNQQVSMCNCFYTL